MYKLGLILFSFLLFSAHTKGFADASGPEATRRVFPEAVPVPKTAQATLPAFTAFTGKVTKSKVRVRIQPTLESPVLRELQKDDLLIVVGETEDFYAILPMKDIKAFVFRTFILDNVVEGNHVNVRLEPTVDSPIIGQLNSGDKVEGVISEVNNKWLEIQPPSTTRFFVSKEYIDKIGDATLIVTIAKRRDEATRLLNSAYQTSQTEFEKSFPEMDLKTVTDSLQSIVSTYVDFPEITQRAKELLITNQENYYRSKIAYLESKTQKPTSTFTEERTPGLSSEFNHPLNGQGTVMAKLTNWAPIEQGIYHKWSEAHPEDTMTDFYEMQKKNSLELRGIIESYQRPVKNKPGDYLLVHPVTKLPVAYLYSTEINLEPRIGQEVVIHGAPRPNHNFAFPAYFVFSVE